MPRNRVARRSRWLTLAALCWPLVAAAQDGTVWDSAGQVLQSPPVAAAGYTRYNFPRRDLTVTLGDVKIAPALALGSWAGFAGGADLAEAMGDLVLLPAELPGVLRELDRSGLEVTAIHNHLAGEAPALSYVHFHGEGTLLSLAAAIDRALRQTATPRPVTPPAAVPLGSDTTEVYRVLGIRGRALGDVVQLAPLLVPGTVSAQGRPLVPALAYGSPLNLQWISSDRMVGAGDFAVLEGSVAPLVHTLTVHGITATAMHSHLIGESPRVYYVHFWADGKPADVLAGLKAALDSVGGPR